MTIWQAQRPTSGDKAESCENEVAVVPTQSTPEWRSPELLVRAEAAAHVQLNFAQEPVHSAVVQEQQKAGHCTPGARSLQPAAAAVSSTSSVSSSRDATE